MEIAGRTFTEAQVGVWTYDAPSGWRFYWRDATSGHHPRAAAARPLTPLQESWLRETGVYNPVVREEFAGMRVSGIDEAAAMFLRFSHGEF